MGFRAEAAGEVKSTLRIDFDANSVEWGDCTYAQSDRTKLGPRSFSATWTPDGFTPSAVVIDTEARTLVLDGIRHALLCWRVADGVTTAETEDVGPGDAWFTEYLGRLAGRVSG